MQNHISNRELFLRYQAQTSDFPMSLEIENAEGVWLTDSTGKKFLDLIAGISVSNVGHRHPKVLEAIHKQLHQYMHLMVYGEYIQSPQVLLAEALASTLPDALNNVYFVNSGSEAIEGAMKLAKRFTGKTEVISCRKAYHGSTQGALSLMSEVDFTQAFLPLLPGVSHIRFGIQDDLEKINEGTAAVFVETVQGEAGIRIASSAYFKALRKKCNETGTLLIADEIQTGFGRTGTFWAFEQFGFVPDVLVCAKGMGGGMPIGAFISSRDLMSVFKNNPILGHITTFGGHPVSCAASLATLEIINNPSFLTEVQRKGMRFSEGLKHPKIKEMRQIGLMMALQLDSFEEVQKVLNVCLEKGLIADWFLFCNDSVRIAPPLTISDQEIDFAISILKTGLDQL